MLNIPDARSLPFVARPQNPYLPLSSASDDAGRRAALAAILREIETAKEAELALASQISVAVSHKLDADERLAAASKATAAAKDAGARAMAAWFGGDQDGARPDATGDVIAGQQVEAIAAAHAETVNGALETLRQDFELVQLRSKHALEAAQQAKQRIVTAHAVALAAELRNETASVENLRGQLLAFLRTTGSSVIVPPEVHAAINYRPHDHAFESPVGAAHAKRWADWSMDLLCDPQWSEFPGV